MTTTPTIAIEVICRGGCNNKPTKQPRHPEDPPEATRLVFHKCDDCGTAYHYEDANGEIVAEQRG